MSKEEKQEIEIKCKFCGDIHKIKVYPSHLETWKNGENIQDALTELNASQRELLISGICPKCWNEMFK